MIDFLHELGNFKQKNFTFWNVRIEQHNLTLHWLLAFMSWKIETSSIRRSGQKFIKSDRPYYCEISKSSSAEFGSGNECEQTMKMYWNDFPFQIWVPYWYLESIIHIRRLSLKKPKFSLLPNVVGKFYSKLFCSVSLKS